MRAAGRSHRRDSNHADVVHDLRQCGYSVTDTSQVGHGCPDLVVSNYGHMRWVELKAGSGSLSADQIAWQVEHKGPPVIVARSAEDVLYAFLKILGDR
jgi:hypothetical protein